MIINKIILLATGVFYLWNIKETQHGLLRWTYVFAGVFLVTISFLERSNIISIIGIVCLISPWLIQTFILKPDAEEN